LWGKLKITQIKMKTKKAQIGETLTWLVATILIVIMMVFFIFGASLLGGTKKIGNFRPGITGKSSFEGGDPFLKKSLFTYVSIGSETKRLIMEKTLSKMASEDKFNLDYNQTKAEVALRYSKK